MPRISAILPLYNGVSFITECMESVQAQTFSDWEFIIINEFGSDDGCAKTVLEYASHDNRIKLIQNSERLGLAESLNVGISQATGRYIARVDVDDPSYPQRFARQVEYLEMHPDVFMCGTLQRSVLPDKAYVLEVPCEQEELKAAMLFGCEISHCSVMFRRDVWVQNGWSYDKGSLCEDYDLWTKIMFSHKIVNLPEVLVDHRWGFDNISIEKGERLHKASRMVSIRTLEGFGVSVSPEDEFLVAGWRNEPKKYAKMNTARFLRKNYCFLTEIEERNQQLHLMDEIALRKILWKRWNWVCKCAGLFFKDIPFEDIWRRKEENQPMVSIVLPVHGAVDTIRETVDSILAQTYTDWELIIVCEHENWDGSTEIAWYYSKMDCRVRVICNEKMEGLANTLNIGMRAARGRYIARIDADDLMNAARLGTQVAYMDSHQDVGITQFYQHYFGQGANDFIHRPPVTAEGMKAKLLFFCDACHSTIMLRREIVERFNLYYDAAYALEDYELWTRAVCVTKFVTIPEVYGEYRVGGRNISNDKAWRIQEDMCGIVARQLRNNLNVKVRDEELYLLNGWVNTFKDLSPNERANSLQALQSLLLKVWEANEKCHYYERRELLRVLSAKWHWSKYDVSWHEAQKVKSIGDALELHEKRTIRKVLFQCLVRKPLSAMQSICLHLEAKNIEHLSNVTKDVASAQANVIDKKVEQWTWERYKRTERKINILEQQNMQLQQALSELCFMNRRIPYIQGEKVRMVFLYQIPSFWPSWESLYKECMENSDIDARLLLLDETNTEKSQMAGAEQFLMERNISYLRFEEFCLEDFMPHVLVIQTPYDEWHRKNEHWSGRFKQMGIRVVYIPYGVEISDTEDSHQLHFRTNVIENSWRIYTFSDVMKKDYYKHASNRRAVRAVGLPRFDYYYNVRGKRLLDNIEGRRAGRKVVVWKVHFPKNIDINGKNTMVTPELSEYVAFARQVRNYSDFFFIFIPHPKFFENKGNKLTEDIKSMVGYLSGCENAWIDYSGDYRDSLVSADYVIIDRSAVMVEAGALNVPVCYVSNKDYFEPVTQAIKPLIDSYYQANDCDGMLDFLNMCLKGKDAKRIVREKAFRSCIPFYDGMNGKRVMGDIVNGVINNQD